MIDLKKPETFKHLDPKDVYSSTGLFAKQSSQMLEEYFGVPFFEGANSHYRKVQNIVICGMGGSAYGGHVLLSLFHDKIKVPVVVNSDYKLPGYADKNTLIMATSYSGSTEEVLSCVEEAKERGAKITGFSSGGKLGEILKENYPGFTFNPKNNPSGQPRLGTGYIVIGTLILLNSLGIISIEKDEFEEAIDEVEKNQNKIKETAQDFAKKLHGYIPLIFTAQHLVGNAHIIRNQLNETSKCISVFEELPELNHHLMEGLKNPEDKKLRVLFLNSDLFSPIHSKRVKLTKDVVSKNKIEHLTYDANGSSKLSQTLELLSFGGYLTLYLGFLYGQDPSVIPWVDYFKEHLGK